MVNNYRRFEVKDLYSITLKVKVPGSWQRPRFDPRPVDGEQSGAGTSCWEYFSCHVCIISPTLCIHSL